MTDALRKSAAADLWWLATHVDDLLESRLKGTPRPWREPAQHDPEQREQARRHDAQERAERTDSAIGEHPAPVHVDTLDLLVDLLATADDLAERIAQAAGVDRLPSPASSFVSAEPYLRHAAAWLQPATDVLPPLLDYVAEQAARLRSLVAVHLHELTVGQRLRAVCPWCKGGIQGGFSLRVRKLADQTVIVCESGTCEPPEADSGIRHRGHPAWSVNEWDWLIQRIEHAAHGGPTCRCGKPLLPTGKVGRPAAYCSAACRREADAERRRTEREAS
jgi:hypothetical protein